MLREESTCGGMTKPAGVTLFPRHGIAMGLTTQDASLSTFPDVDTSSTKEGKVPHQTKKVLT